MGKAVDTTVDFEIDPTISEIFKEIIFVDKVLRDVGELDAEIFRAVERGLEIEVVNVKRDKLGAFSREDAIYDKLEEIQGSSFDTNVTRVADVIAVDGDTGAIGVGFFRADKTDHFGVGGSFAPILWDVLVKDELEGIGTFDELVGLGGFGSDALAEAADFIGV